MLDLADDDADRPARPGRRPGASDSGAAADAMPAHPSRVRRSAAGLDASRDDPEASELPVPPWRRAVIERIAPHTPSVVSVFLKVNIAPIVAGQHVEVRLDLQDGRRTKRRYSIASAPDAPVIELAVQQQGDGEASSYFHEVAKPGDAVEVRGPIGGRFVWRPDGGGPTVLVGGGTGVAPLMSMVRRQATASYAPMLLVYSARGWDEMIFRDELLEAHEHQPGFSLVLATTRGRRRRRGDLTRRLDAAAMAEILARWGEAPGRAYVCGSNPFVEAACQALTANGVSRARILVERYGGG